MVKHCEGCVAINRVLPMLRLCQGYVGNLALINALVCASSTPRTLYMKQHNIPPDS